jgi:hypothetical protein
MRYLVTLAAAALLPALAPAQCPQCGGFSQFGGRVQFFRTQVIEQPPIVIPRPPLVFQDVQEFGFGQQFGFGGFGGCGGFRQGFTTLPEFGTFGFGGGGFIGGGFGGSREGGFRSFSARGRFRLSEGEGVGRRGGGFLRGRR